MIGNDVVDIAQAEKDSNWQRPRFLEKLFAPEEQQLIKNSEDAFLMVWRLWSMKEAAYKLYTQIHPSRFYNPKAFRCDLKGDKGKVHYRDFKCYVNTKITSQYVLSEAHLCKSRMLSKTVILKNKDVKNQSKTIRTVLLEAISKHYKQPISSIYLKTSKFGIPKVFLGSRIINVSISHHGNYGAFAIANQ